MAPREVLCVGIACADLLIRGVDLATPFESESKTAQAVELSVGGDAANEAVVLARLGHGVQLMCGLGADGTAAYIRAAVSASGVDMSCSVQASEGGSAVNVIVVQPDGQRNFINSGIPPAASFTPRLEAVKGMRVVSMASLFLPPFHDPQVCVAVARAAKEAGAILCQDVVMQPGSRLGDIAPALAWADYIFPNEEEARQLTGKEELEDIADVFLETGVKNVIIKTGAKGCFVKNGQGSFTVPACRVARPVDTTGAGDNFAAGFISALLQGKSLGECCRWACGVAAVAIKSMGACTGVKSRGQVEQAIRELE